MGSAADGTARLTGSVLDEIDDLLADADEQLATLYPGDPGTRQPVHTVYVNADLATPDVAVRWGRQATELLDAVAPTPAAAAAVTGLDGVDEAVYERVRAKLDRQPIEDLRLDFEDGYGTRPDAEEDAHAVATGELLGRLLGTAGAPSFAGIRFKSLERPTRRRGLRTLDLVLAELLTAGDLPAGFVVTLPKVTSVDQVRAMVRVCAELERAHGLPAGALRFEIQVETTQAILGADGAAAIAQMLHAAENRCPALHYGTFDYSAACGVSAAQQSLAHPVADHAKAVMQVAAAGTGVRVADGSTNVMPVGEPAQIAAAVGLHAQLVRRSLERAYYQGWDMHPGHLVSRYLATYAFYRDGFPGAAQRLANYLARQGGGIVDEPATAQALAAFVVRGVHCGAVDDAEVLTASGVDRATLDALAQRRPLAANP